RNYTDFCGAGRKFDDRLAQLGASRLHPRADCDVDYEAPARAWMEALWPALRACVGKSEPGISWSVIREVASAVNGATRPGTDSLISSSPGFSRTNPFPARLITNRRLNAPASAKDTRHFEIALADSGLSYEVGDALGVMPANCPALVEEMIEALGCDGEEAVTAPSG